MNKKGLDISLNFIIIAALALIALIIMVLIFTGGMEKIIGQQKNIVDIAASERAVAEDTCKWYCSIGSEASWSNPDFPEKVAENYPTCDILMGKSFANCAD